MERKNTKKSAIVKSKSQKWKKKLEGFTYESRRIKGSKEVKAKAISISSDSSGSDKTDEDYAEFLKTYDPQEVYPNASSSGEEDGSQITVEFKVKPPESPEIESDSE
jgi:hypothetical protein